MKKFICVALLIFANHVYGSSDTAVQGDDPLEKRKVYLRTKYLSLSDSGWNLYYRTDQEGVDEIHKVFYRPDHSRLLSHRIHEYLYQKRIRVLGTNGKEEEHWVNISREEYEESAIHP